jgi:hypothetical protein
MRRVWLQVSICAVLPATYAHLPAVSCYNAICLSAAICVRLLMLHLTCSPHTLTTHSTIRLIHQQHTHTHCYSNRNGGNGYTGAQACCSTQVNAYPSCVATGGKAPCAAGVGSAAPGAAAAGTHTHNTTAQHFAAAAAAAHLSHRSLEHTHTKWTTTFMCILLLT